MRFEPTILFDAILNHFGYYTRPGHNLSVTKQGVDGFDNLCNILPKYKPRFISPIQAYMTKTTEGQVVIKLNRSIQLVLLKDGTWKEWKNR